MPYNNAPDNESVFDMLSTYFRKAKNKRQIILITHNPNLVINTDSDQIIIAQMEKQDNLFPHIRYISGALEAGSTNSENSIREHVCRILEGGEIAFLKREKRYDIKMSDMRSADT